MAVMSRFAALTTKYPVVRGMLSYSITWPVSSLIQQAITGRKLDNFDYIQAARFSLFGCFFTAPTLYLWVRISSKFWPHMNFRTAVTKACVEQLCYGPLAMISFFFGMSLLEGRSVKEAQTAVEKKFVPAYKVGVCFWPVMQTINFLYVPERNRVIFVSCGSVVWACFLSYMQQLNPNPLEEQLVYQIPLKQ